MILDNKNENHKVYEWLTEYTESGTIPLFVFELRNPIF